MVLSEKLATLIELETVYGLEDLFKLAEVILIDNFNKNEAIRKANVHNR